jgi:hypothetical protein
MIPAQFRKYASECLKWAAAETDESKRQALIDTANMWTRAALTMEMGPSEDMPLFIIPAPNDGVGSDGVS